MKFVKRSFFIVCVFLALGVLVTGCAKLIEAQTLSNLFSFSSVSGKLESDINSTEQFSYNETSKGDSSPSSTITSDATSGNNEFSSAFSSIANDSSSLLISEENKSSSADSSSSISSSKQSTNTSSSVISKAIVKVPVKTTIVTAPSPTPKPPIVAVSTAVASKLNLQILIGQSESSIISKFGQPRAKELSEYGFRWYVYNSDYKRFIMIGIASGKVVGVYSNSSALTFEGLGVGKTRSTVRATLLSKFGKPLTGIQKGNTRYIINSAAQRDIFYNGSSYTTIFYDNILGGTLTSIQIIAKNTELSIGYYGTPSAELARSFEKTSFYLANAIRARMGKAIYVWDDKMASIARAHSTEMYNKNYFSHTSLNGLSSSGRFRAAGLVYSNCAENIAKNHTSAITAHESYMNSSGHRANLLNTCKRLGVGVCMGKGSVLLTQDFITYK